MALTITDTTNIQKPINAIYQQTLLRTATPLCPYFVGSQKGVIQKASGTNTIKWRRIENITPSTTPLSELTGNAEYMQGRTPDVPTFTDVTAALAKYGQFFIVNEEVDLFNYSSTNDGLMRILGIAAGQSMNRLQRNVLEDNATLVYAGGAASSGAVVSKITANAIKSVVQTLDVNVAMPFTAMTTGSQNINTTPVLPSYWGIAHPYVADDIAALSGFTSVEKYAGQVDVAPGEFGIFQAAGRGVRFIKTSEASIDASSGGAVGSTGLRSTNASLIDLFTTLIFGQDAHGSVGLGKPHTDGIFRAGDMIPGFDIIMKDNKSGGTSDPFEEIRTMAYKFWHAGSILNGTWIRGIRSGATDLD